KENLKIICIPTSFQSYQLITQNGLTLGNLDNYPKINVDIDGADEVDSELNVIKGGGGCHVQEKIIASNSEKLIIIADYRKDSENLGEKWKKGVPIEVIPLGYVPIMKNLESMGGKPVLRMAKSKAGPCISDNGNFIIDADFGIIKNPRALNSKIKMIPGVVDTGLFINSVSANIPIAYIGMKDGSVKEKLKK
ncbi:MAG: ribose 5-phosphate isomerase A, partial [Promethearchaeota archaeon]